MVRFSTFSSSAFFFSLINSVLRFSQEFEVVQLLLRDRLRRGFAHALEAEQLARFAPRFERRVEQPPLRGAVERLQDFLLVGDGRARGLGLGFDRGPVERAVWLWAGATERQLGLDHQVVQVGHAVPQSVEGVHPVVQVVVFAEQVLSVDDAVGRDFLSGQVEHLSRVRGQRVCAAPHEFSVVVREVFVLQEEKQLVLGDVRELRFYLFDRKVPFRLLA